MQIREQEPLAPHTTFDIGGTARFFVEAHLPEEISEALLWARERGVRYWIFAGGSNVVFGDGILDGLIIKVCWDDFSIEGEKIIAGAGVPLMQMITRAMESGLAGLETLSGIPGTVGGAIFGNAAAYGQAISDTLLRVEILDDGKTRWLTKDECGFSYRSSLFKANDWIILRAEFRLVSGEKEVLQAKSREIIALREEKYPPGLKCPGSFFKNVLMENIPTTTRSMIPSNRDYYGKVPAWFFLNEVGARGMVYGGLRVADIHGNLIVNTGGATHQDVCGLVGELKQRVRDRFDIELEEEVRYIV